MAPSLRRTIRSREQLVTAKLGMQRSFGTLPVEILLRTDPLKFVVYLEQQRRGQRPDKRLLQHGRMTAVDIDQSKVLDHRAPAERLVGVGRGIWGVAQNRCAALRPHEHGGCTA